MSGAHQPHLPLPKPVELVEGHPAPLCQVRCPLLTWRTKNRQAYLITLSKYLLGMSQSLLILRIKQLTLGKIIANT